MVTLSDETFSAHVTANAGKSAVCVTGAHCPHCRAYAPTFEKAAAEHPAITFFRLDASTSPATCATFGVRSIPTTLLFDGERLVSRRVGDLPAVELRAFLTEFR